MKHAFKIQDKFLSFATICDCVPIAMALIDRAGTLVAVNDKMASFSGLNKNAIIGRNLSEFSKEGAYNLTRDFIFFDQGKEVSDHDLEIAGTPYAVAVKPVRDKEGVVIGEIVALTNISRIKETEYKLKKAYEELKILASKDPLTGVYNARSYYETCDLLINGAHRNNREYSLLFIDIDYFKQINDTFGHHAGDEILKALSSAIERNLRKSDILGRVGGEEFSIFLPDTNKEGALHFAEKIRSMAENLMPVVNGNSHRITVSIGAASRMKHHKSISDIQRDADHAMYHAKMNGRNIVSALSEPCYVEKKMTKEGCIDEC